MLSIAVRIGHLPVMLARHLTLLATMHRESITRPFMSIAVTRRIPD